MKWAAVRKRLWRGLAAVLLLLILLVGIGMVYQSTASAQDRETYAPTGQLFEVNGHTMHLYCIGEGGPTVILEAGVGRQYPALGTHSACHSPGHTSLCL